MPIKKLTLGFGLLCAGATLASPSYIVRKGDTLSEIAEKLHVSTKALAEVNNLGSKRPLKIGMKLLVPKERVAKKSSKSGDLSRKSHVPSGGDTYTVKAGENDWIIAHRAGIKLKQLHALNPNVKFAHLQVGTHLHLPAGKVAEIATPRLRSRYAVVKGDNVTIRRNAGTSSEAICTTNEGTRVAVLAREGGWYKLKFPKGTIGWIRGDFLKAAAPQHVAKRHTVTTSYVATMKRRKTSHHATRVARAHHAKHSGASYVVAPQQGGGDLIARAESYRGVRYRWGQASRSGTDCSGFTTQVFRGAGVKLPRTSREQATVGNKIDRGHLDKGDLVFFRTGRGHRITHVGIYVGGGKFIHASSGGGKVQVNKLSDGYYSNRFVTARRVPTKKKVAAKEHKTEEASVASE